MLVAIFGLDRPGSNARARLLEDHRAWLAAAPFTVCGSGPLMDETGAAMIGSLILLEADSVAAVRDAFADEPLNRVGGYESLEIRRWTLRVGAFAP